MSFRGAPRGRGFGGGGGGRGGFGGGGFGGRGGGRGGFGGRDVGPPAEVIELGTFMHPTEGEMVCESTNPKIPYFNAQIFLENKTAVGKIDEVFGPIGQVYFTIKPSEGIQATSFKSGDKFFIGGDKLLPLEKFLPKPKALGAPKPKRAGGAGRGGRGGPRGGARGGRGGFSPARGRGGARGGSRGGFSSGGFSPGGRGRGGSRGGGFSRGRY